MGRSTVQDWLDGPSDLKEAVVKDVPVPGKDVKVRELPAKFSAEVSGQMKVTTERGEQVATVDVPKMERLQFVHGVVDPVFTEEQAAVLQERYGSVFKKVIAKIDELSGVDKEAIEKAQATFPSPQRHANGTSEAVEVPAAGGGS